jgi:hypothetical protein
VGALIRQVTWLLSLLLTSGTEKTIYIAFADGDLNLARKNLLKPHLLLIKTHPVFSCNNLEALQLALRATEHCIELVLQTLKTLTRSQFIQSQTNTAQVDITPELS